MCGNCRWFQVRQPRWRVGVSGIWRRFSKGFAVFQMIDVVSCKSIRQRAAYLYGRSITVSNLAVDQNTSPGVIRDKFLGQGGPAGRGHPTSREAFRCWLLLRKRVTRVRISGAETLPELAGIRVECVSFVEVLRCQGNPFSERVSLDCREQR